MIWSFSVLTGVMCSFHKCLLRACCRAYAALGAVNVKRNKTLNVSALVELTF